MARGTALRILAEFGEGQWGMVTAAQAAGRGVNTTMLTRLVQAGLLEPLTRGVYRLPGHGPDLLDTVKAAWLRLDPQLPAWERKPLGANGGVVSHRSAAAAHRIGDLVAERVEITVPRRRTTRDAHMHLRRGRLAPDEVTRLDGLPVTTVERTVVDLLADHVDGGHIGDVIADANQQGVLDVDKLAAQAEPFAIRYGVRGRDGQALLSSLTELAGRGPIGQIAEINEQVDQLAASLRAAVAAIVKPNDLQLGGSLTADWRRKIMDGLVAPLRERINVEKPPNDGEEK